MDLRRLRTLRHRLLRRGDHLERMRADGARIGEDVFIHEDCVIDGSHRHLVTIEDGATLAPRVIVLAHDASTKHHLGYTRVGLVHIGRRCFIGAGSVVLPGVTIGDGSIIGAGSVVTKSVPAGVVATGNPCLVRGRIADFVARRREEMAAGPVWEREGWTVDTGLTPARQEEQRRGLADGTAGYLE